MELGSRNLRPAAGLILVRPLGKQINVDHYRDRGDRRPNYAQFPNGVLSRSTTDDIDSSNAPFRHLNLVAGPRPRGCAHHSSGPLYPVSTLPFRPHVDTAPGGRRPRAPLVLLPGTTAQPSLLPPLLFLQIVDARCSPFRLRIILSP